MVGSDWKILGRLYYNMKICTLPFPQTPFLGKGTYYRFAQSSCRYIFYYFQSTYIGRVHFGHKIVRGPLKKGGTKYVFGVKVHSLCLVLAFEWPAKTKAQL